MRRRKKEKEKEAKLRTCGLVLSEDENYLLTLNMRTDGRLIVMESVEDKSEFLADQPLAVLKAPGQWNRTIATLKAGQLSVVINGKSVLEKIEIGKRPKESDFALMDHGHEIDFANVFVRELK